MVLIAATVVCCPELKMSALRAKVTWAYVEVSRLALDLEEGGAAAEAGWLTVANVESGLHPHSRFAGNEYPGCVGGLGRRVGDNDRVLVDVDAGSDRHQTSRCGPEYMGAAPYYSLR